MHVLQNGAFESTLQAPPTSFLLYLSNLSNPFVADFGKNIAILWIKSFV